MKRTRLAGIATVFALVWVFAAAVPANAAPETAPDAHHAAADHGEEHAEGAHAASIRDLLFPAINFSIYLIIIVRFVIPAMREYLRQRRSEAVAAATQAGEALAQAERAVAANQQRRTALASETESIRQDLVTIATRQGERLVAQAEESGTRRLADAGLMAQQERRRALAGVRAEVATVAVDMAEQKIRTALTPGDQRSFVEQFLKDAAAQ
jgi:F0F1-type ATP synthase membrane subunit b/b'